MNPTIKRKDYNYPFFHWVTGVWLSMFGVGGFILGVVVGAAL